jgi:gamma-glutamylcyclotransferase
LRRAADGPGGRPAPAETPRQALEALDAVRFMRPTFDYYFAYGSNMLTHRLRARCPSAEPVTIGYADDLAVAFHKLSTDRSGKATLVAERASRALGVVFRIAPGERGALDRAEAGYVAREAFPVVCRSGARIESRTYLASREDPRLRPYDWYLALLLAGMQEHGIDAAYRRRFRSAAFDFDPKLDRTTRLEALDALSRAGLADYRALLPDS